MAPRKRSRALNDIDGEIEIETESASSSFRQQQFPKRSRIALAQENGGSVVSDDDDDDDVGGNGGVGSDFDSSPPPSDNEVHIHQATQVDKHTRTLRDNMASEQGVIEEVYCRNFMCHSKLRIKLGPLINFIIGHNGSGKSAVLTALTMCLGGKASATNRAGSMKNLIKEGEESATLAVRIKNQGEGAYKSELYGESITVERNFTRSGTSGFKLKNAEGKVITTKKADLDDILDFFAFQLDNPINVLTQDMARQFLSNSSSLDKYKFFIRGTQLEALDTDYRVLEEHLDGIEAKLQGRKQDIEVLERKMQDAEAKKKRAEQTGKIREKIERLQWMHAWAQVEEQEQELEKFQRKAQEAEDKVQENTESAEVIIGRHEGHNQSFEAAERTLNDLQEQLEPVKETYKGHKEQFDANKGEIAKALGDERTMRDNMKKYKKNVLKLGSDIAEEQERLAGGEGDEHAERLSNLEVLKQAAEDAKNEHMSHGTGFAQVENKRKDAANAAEADRAAFDQQKEAVQSAERKLQSLRQQQPRPFAGFRAKMDDLVREIGRETRWRTKPVGPMGMHVKLLQAEWSSQIERTFGGTLDSFVVTNKEDQGMLSKLMKRVGCVTNIYIGDPTPLDTTGKEPEEEVVTILRVLEIDNQAVRNQLIINQGIDQTVLIKDRQQAESYMNSNPRPRNVRVTMCMDDHNRRNGLRFELSRGGNAKSSPIAQWTGDTRMKSNREDQIRASQEDLSQAKRDFQTAEQRKRELDIALKEAGQEVTRFKRRNKELLEKSQRAEDAVEGLQAEIDSHRPQDGRLQELAYQLAEEEDHLKAAEDSFQDMVNEKDKLNETAHTLKARLEDAHKELDQAKKNVDKAEKRLETIGNARHGALMEKNLALETIDRSKKTLTAMQEKCETQSANVEAFINEAKKICSRRIAIEPPGLTAEALDERIDKFIKDQMRAERDQGGTMEELTMAFYQARQEHVDATSQLKDMITCSVLLRKTLHNRYKRWQTFRQMIAARARITFTYLLSERQFRGEILMDHSKKELDITVEPDISKESNKKGELGRATKTLSGGEKSFSTICLLLSIWEAMGSPIRCLDEFDVFMDSVNRATSMNMMIKAARRAVGRQFILITPQAMGNVEMGDDVRVHKMSDPERGQTTLPFGGTQVAL